MTISASQRATLVKEIAKRLAAEEWPFIDATLNAFSLPTNDVWEGSITAYVLNSLRDAPENSLLELATHVGFSPDIKPIRIDPPFWRAGMFRLFITHLAAHKLVAASLQTSLHEFGISSFVAHNDIEPSKEWQNEIETALSTCEALIALLHPEFHKSNWTDQEIGYAMGRGVPVYAVRFGQDPYGFIGRFQAFNGANKSEAAIANEVFETLRKGKQTQYRIAEALVYLFGESPSYKDSKKNVRHLEELSVWQPSFTTQLRSALKFNNQVADSFGVPERIEALISKWTKK
jgi:nucleoside 2-deoxyribosyltransferase